MGNFSSKPQLDMSFENVEDGCPCDGDPRSPSVDIERTPIQAVTGTNNKITKNMNLTKECFDKYEEAKINPALRNVMNEFDPRSPTLDFERTPLAFLLRDPEWVAAHNNLNTSAILDVSVETHQPKELEPKNLCNELANLSLQSEHNSSIRNDNEDDEKVNDAPQEVDQMTVGLLETNFDYLETDVDKVRHQKSKELNEKLKHITVETKTDIVQTKVDNDVIVQEIVEQVMSSDVAYKDLSDQDPRSPSGGIDRTPILVAERESLAIESKKIKSSKKINSRVKDVLRNNAKMQKNTLYHDMLNKENDVKNIARDSLLIYEDNIESTTPVSSVKHNTESSRTPLACMMNIDKPTPLHNTPNDNVNIKISSVKSKIPIRVSKLSPNSLLDKGDIKNVKLINNLDLENTPPRPRKACWDRDNSVIL